MQGEVGKEVFKLIDKAGVVPLAWGENGYRQLSNSKHEIKTPADMKGLKLARRGLAAVTSTPSQR